MRARPDARPPFSTATRTNAAFLPLSWQLPRKPARTPATHVSSTSNSPYGGPPATLTLARRNLCSIFRSVVGQVGVAKLMLVFFAHPLTGLARTAFRPFIVGGNLNRHPNNTRSDYGNAGDFLCSISCFLLMIF